MARAKNRVIAGDYVGRPVAQAFGVASMGRTLKDKSMILDKATVASYELLTDEHRKSAKSGVARGLAGGFLLGGVGAVVGAASAKQKGVYQIALQFKNGKRSLLEVDDKVYKAIIKSCF